MTAMAVGIAVTVLALGYVLYPLLVGAKPRDAGPSGAPCPKCGAPTHPDASFCAACGEMLLRAEGNDGLE